jgi:hypothetical protein
MIIYDLYAKRATTFNQVFEYYQLSDGEEVIVDLTGYTAKLQVRVTPDSDDLLLEVVPVITISTASILVEFTAEQTEALFTALAGKCGTYDLQLIDPDGKPYAFAFGRLFVLSNTIHEDEE